MNRWHSAYETIKFSIKVLLLGLLFNAIGMSMLNVNVVNFFNITNQIVFLIANIFIYLGGLIVDFFPLIVLLVILCARNDDFSTVINGFINYLVFYVVMMFVISMVVTKVYPSYTYFSLFSVDLSALNLGTATQSPFLTGMIGSLCIAYITRRVHRTTQRSGGYGFLGFMNSNSWSILWGIVLSALLGVAFAFVWPKILDVLFAIFTSISADVKNPISLFIFGFVDRVMSLLNLSSIIRSQFWLGQAGGSWMDSFGSVSVGDLRIWLAQQNLGLLVESGKFTSAYYVTNIFALPGYLIALFRTYTSRLERRKNILLFIGLYLIVALSGNMYGIELIMLMTAPFLYAIHLVLFSITFALMGGLSIYIGFSTFITLSSANPGNIIDYFTYLNKAQTGDHMVLIAYIGIIMFVAYFLITTYFYSSIALDILHTGIGVRRIDDTIDALGGLDNIKAIQSTPTAYIALLADRSKFNISKVHGLGVTRIVESRVGYTLYYGAGSFALCREINRKLKKNQITRQIQADHQV